MTRAPGVSQPVAAVVAPIAVAAAAAIPAPSPTVAEEGGLPAENGEGPEPPSWPDEMAESSFLADARERGEPVKATPAAVEIAEESDPKALPKLDDLVNRIPAEVRETLEDLFRAKFVRVQRVPKRVLKTEAKSAQR